jgi:hypothetical protein
MSMAKELDTIRLSSPRIFLFRMLLFVLLAAAVVVALYKQIAIAFLANPPLNGVSASTAALP